MRPTVPCNSAHILYAPVYVCHCLLVAKACEGRKRSRTIRNSPSGPQLNAPSQVAPHLPFYLENQNLHFIRHHRSLPPWHPSLRPGREKVPMFTLEQQQQSSVLIIPRQLWEVRHAPLHFWQAFTIHFYNSALTKMLIPWEGKKNLSMSALAQTNILKEMWNKTTLTSFQR